MPINQLVYVSQAVRKMSPADLAAIREKAKPNNAPLDVSGSLFYNGGWFLQVFEELPAMLDLLYNESELVPRTKIREFCTTRRPNTGRSHAEVGI